MLLLLQVESVKRVLVVLGKMCEVDFCPLLVDLVALLSNLLPEAAVYTAVYHMYGLVVINSISGSLIVTRIRLGISMYGSAAARGCRLHRRLPHVGL